MATKKKSEPKPDAENKPTAAQVGIAKRVNEKDTSKTYDPNKAERVIGSYVKRRITEMQDFRRGLAIEQKWKEADEEYVPHELDFGTTRKRFETDQDTGLRSRMVPVGDATQQWRQASSAPTLLAKIQTAVSIIIDNQPEADLVALEKKYMATTHLAYALWKRNWQITDAKEKLKLFVFNLIKYGWAPQRTYPRVVKYPKRVRTSIDTENPENDKYEERELVWFNDVDREPLDPFRTWIDELSKPYDPLSTNENYYEVDYSYDAFKVEFGTYPRFDNVPRDSAMTHDQGTGDSTNRGKIKRSEGNVDSKSRKDIVTVGFFESRLKDVFVLWIPKWGIVLYQSPLPNDDGYLSITHSLYLLRTAKLPYGVSLWEIIRQNKGLYDKMKNMTMDQLVLSIMKFGFFSGTNTALGDGKIDIIPGQARQLTSSTGKPEVNWMEIPGPGKEAWAGMEAVSNMMDDESGISPTLEGEVTGKTLGEILHAKEAALKRMKTPVENIAWAIEQDAYLTLSWMSQVYSIPTVKNFTDEAEMMAFEKENQVTRHELFADEDPETGERVGIKATYLPQLSLHLEDRDGKLVQGRDSSFFTVGQEIKITQLKWRGLFKVIPRSIIDSSQELIKATKMELFNMLAPLFAQPPELMARPAKQILEANEEDYEDWFPDSWIQYIEQGGQQPPAPGEPGANIFTKLGITPPSGAGAPPLPGQTGLAMGPQMPPAGPQQPQPMQPNGQSMQANQNMTPQQLPTVVPRSQASSPMADQIQTQAKGLFNRSL